MEGVSKIILLLHVFDAVGIYLPSRCVATIVGMRAQTHRLMGGIYEMRR
jgi:hypothetical protein